MATTKLNTTVKNEPSTNPIDNLTTAVERTGPSYTGPYVSVFLRKLEDSGDGGGKVDQFEHVTLANEQKEDSYYVLRGEWVSVPVPVYMALKEKYGKEI